MYSRAFENGQTPPPPTVAFPHPTSPLPITATHPMIWVHQPHFKSQSVDGFGGIIGGNVSAPGARRASFWTRAPLVAF